VLAIRRIQSDTHRERKPQPPILYNTFVINLYNNLLHNKLLYSYLSGSSQTPPRVNSGTSQERGQVKFAGITYMGEAVA